MVKIIRSFKFLMVMVTLGVVAGVSQQPQILEFARILSDVFMRLLKLVSFI